MISKTLRMTRGFQFQNASHSDRTINGHRLITMRSRIGAAKITANKRRIHPFMVELLTREDIFRSTDKYAKQRENTKTNTMALGGKDGSNPGIGGGAYKNAERVPAMKLPTTNLKFGPALLHNLSRISISTENTSIPQITKRIGSSVPGASIYITIVRRRIRILGVFEDVINIGLTLIANFSYILACDVN